MVVELGTGSGDEFEEEGGGWRALDSVEGNGRIWD